MTRDSNIPNAMSLCLGWHVAITCQCELQVYRTQHLCTFAIRSRCMTPSSEMEVPATCCKSNNCVQGLKSASPIDRDKQSAVRFTWMKGHCAPAQGSTGLQLCISCLRIQAICFCTYGSLGPAVAKVLCLLLRCLNGWRYSPFRLGKPQLHRVFRAPLRLCLDGHCRSVDVRWLCACCESAVELEDRGQVLRHVVGGQAARKGQQRRRCQQLLSHLGSPLSQSAQRASYCPGNCARWQLRDTHSSYKRLRLAI